MKILKKIESAFKQRKTWTLIGILLGAFGYSQYVPVTDAVADVVVTEVRS